MTSWHPLCFTLQQFHHWFFYYASNFNVLGGCSGVFLQFLVILELYKEPSLPVQNSKLEWFWFQFFPKKIKIKIKKKKGFESGTYFKKWHRFYAWEHEQKVPGVSTLVPFSWGRGTRTPSRELLQCSYGALPDTKMERKSSFELNICNMRVAFLGLLCKVDCYCQLLRRKEELQQKKKKAHSKENHKRRYSTRTTFGY